MRSFVLMLGLISIILDLYVYQGIKKLTAGWKSLFWRRVVRWGYWAFVVIFIALFIYAINLRFSEDVTNNFVQWMINAFLTLFVTKLFFVVILFAEDIFRIIKAIVRLLSKGNNEGNKNYKIWPERRRFVSQLGLAFASIPFAAFLYGVTKGKYSFTVHRHTLYFDDLPAAFDGFKITQISDIHSGSLDDLEEVKRGLELAQAQEADLFVFTGDMVNDEAAEVVPFMKALSQLKAPYGQYSILGNHDYGMYHDWESEAAEAANLEQLKQYQAAMGFKLLLDEHVTLEKDGESITLLGVENWGRGFIEKGDLDKALTGVPEDAFKVLLSHDPSHFEEIVKKHPTHVHLTLSGHTHGMQFGVETPLVKWSPVQYRYAHWAGVKEEFKRFHYVNRGFGFIGFTGRVGIWPEITVLELRRGKV